MLPALILIGFAMITLGVALLFIGAVPFLAGKRISAGAHGLIGVVLVSFLPLCLRPAKHRRFTSAMTRSKVRC